MASHSPRLPRATYVHLSRTRKRTYLVCWQLCFAVCIVIWALVGMVIGQIRTLKSYGWLANSAVWINLA